MTALAVSTLPAFRPGQLESASPDLLRQMRTAFISALMSAEADAVCGAPYDRVNVATATGTSCITRHSALHALLSAA
jgi:hypothetical protein